MNLPRPLILASRSPRRKLLLDQIGLRPRVVPCDVPEDLDVRLSPAENARVLAERKAECIAGKTSEGIVLGADTIVAIGDAMLGKPDDPDDARRMLRLLSGATHTVYTGFALIDRPANRRSAGVEATRVTFRELPDDEIAEYVQGGSPMDKAGAYGIQDDYGAVFVTRIEGCYYNVVGLPLARVYTALRALTA
jgi:septum formation protein